MKQEDYKTFMEKKLVEEFREKFKEKIGYYPIVFLKKKNVVMQLEELKSLVEKIMWKKCSDVRGIKLCSLSRKASIVRYRKIYFYLAKEMGHTLAESGKMVNRDHTTAVHNVQQAKNHLDTQDRIFEVAYSSVSEELEKYREHENENTEHRRHTRSRCMEVSHA